MTDWRVSLLVETSDLSGVSRMGLKRADVAFNTLPGPGRSISIHKYMLKVDSGPLFTQGYVSHTALLPASGLNVLWNTDVYMFKFCLL